MIRLLAVKYLQENISDNFCRNTISNIIILKTSYFNIIFQRCVRLGIYQKSRSRSEYEQTQRRRIESNMDARLRKRMV